MSDPPKLLVVEDDTTIGDVVTTTLRRHGCSVDWVPDGHSALSAAEASPFDLVLLDLGLPDLDGIEVCRRIRALRPATVLVILTARSAEMDVVVGLESGADDYLSKPVRLTELVARVRAHLRRVGTPDDPQVLTVGHLSIDLGGRRVTLSGEELPLRAKEFDLLARLAVEPGTAVRREVLMADVWDEHWYGSTKTLDFHVAALRRRLAAASTDGPTITTVRGHGYRLERAEPALPEPSS